ncbi:MAG: DUF1724 domain-containing protein [Methanobrevibacter sp.]|nr:DUF1724 domain-containing protein [Methanobrevibacter sp.]
MFKNEEYIENFEEIFENVRFTANSYVRLKILACLYEKPQNMREMTDATGLSYSSVSSNMHDMELKNILYRDHNKYYLTNSAKVRIENVLELKWIISLLNEFFNILDGHIVDMIPNESVMELYLLGKAKLMESSGVDAYRTYNFIEKCLSQAESVKCIMPFFYESFFSILRDLISKNKDVEILVPQMYLEVFQEKSEIEDLVPFKEYNSFLLIVTDKVMILGLFLENGYFDQNRLLTSKNEESIEWANNLFKNFKKENK